MPAGSDLEVAAFGASCVAGTKINLHKAHSGLHMTDLNMALYICT